MAQESLKAIGSFLESLPEAVQEEEVTTDDVSFREGFHAWLRDVKGTEEGEEEEAVWNPKRHPRKERVLRDPLPSLTAVEGETSDETFGVEEIVEEAGNVLRSRIPIPRAKRRK